MKIAMIVPGGVDRSGEYRVIPALLALIKRLASKHDIHVFAFRQEVEPASWDLYGARVQNIGAGLTQWRCIRAISRSHREKAFDVVQSIFSGSCGLICVVAAKLLGIPSVVHVAGGELAALHDIEYGGARTVLGRMRERWILRNASAVTAASAPIIAQVARFGAVARRIPLGVDLMSWPVRQPAQRMPEEPLRLIHVASLNRVKDHPTMLRALAFLSDAGVDFHLDLIGEDTLNGAIEKRARELDISERISFHGFITQRELRPLMLRAHINVLASRHEAGPLALLEAAVVGVPTVGTAVGHLAEWEPEACLSVSTGNSQQLAFAIQRLAEDEELRLRIAHQAKKCAVAEDADFTAQRFEELYREIAR